MLLFFTGKSFDDMTGGIEYFHFLEKQQLPTARMRIPQGAGRKLKETAGKLFAADNLMVSYTADEEGYKLCRKN